MSIARSHRTTALILIALLLLVLGAASLLRNDYYSRVFMLIGINIILAVSLNLTSGFTGVFSLGQIGFMAIGAYGSALLTLSPAGKSSAMLPDLPRFIAQINLAFLPSPLQLLVAGVVAALLAAGIAALVGIPLMRLSGHYVAVATMGFLVIAHAVAVNLEGVTRGARGLTGLPRLTNLWVVYLLVAITVYVVWRLLRSPYGRAMLAQRENLAAAQAMGVDILRTRLLAFVIGAFFSALAGALWAHLVTTVAPTAFYFTYTFNVIIMVIVGGMGSVTGSVIGAVLLTILPEVLAGLENGAEIGPIQLPQLFGMSQIILAVAFVLVMIYRRQGLYGGRELPMLGGRGASSAAMHQPTSDAKARATRASPDER